jgi:chromosome segregation ATPase
MTSVQENKNELEAAVRYCESAISRAKATIESMEFRQQAATKAWHEQTGREESLTKKLAFMTEEYDRMKGYADRLLDEQGTMESELEERISEVADLKVQLVEERDRSMGYTKEIAELKSELDELSKAYKDSTREEITMKQAWCEQREIVALRDDQIAMLERRLAKKDNPYPFKEGDIYYVLNQLDGTWVESVWDDESESMHDNTSVPDHPHKVYFTVDQKNVLGKFKIEYD